MTALDWLIRPIAHRGLHGMRAGIIENTASAFAAAIDAGYAIETDVQPAADGEVMVFHDDALDRLTQATGRVDRKSADELRQVVFRDTGDRMQTLGELLDQVSGRVPLVIEVKSDWKARGPVEKRIAALLAGYRGHAAVMSFDPKSVAALAVHGPAIPRGLVAERFADAGHWGHLTAIERFRMRHLLSAFIARPQFVAYDIRALPALAPLVVRHLFGWPILTWTVRTGEQRRTAARWADAMIFEGFRP